MTTPATSFRIVSSLARAGTRMSAADYSRSALKVSQAFSVPSS